MPLDPETQQQIEEPTIEGKTFEEWEAKYQQITTKHQAREITLLKFGYHPDQQVESAPEPDSGKSAE